jgi:hypothetical protein
MTNSELVFVFAGLAAVLGLIAGLVRPRMHGAPAAATALVIVAYVLIVALAGVWAADCRGCDGWVGSDSSRVVDFQSAIFLGGILAVGVIAVTWAGAGIAALVRRRLRSHHAS